MSFHFNRSSGITSVFYRTLSSYRRCYSTQHELIQSPESRDLRFDFQKKSVRWYIKWSLLGFIVFPPLLYQHQQKRTQLKIKERDRHITEYVYMDIAKGDRYLGRILIGLYGDIVPMTVNNFLRLVEGYQVKDKLIGYKNTKIHTVVLGKMVIAGDVVTGNGAESLSIYGPLFPDENYSQPFLRRGDLAMYGRKRNGNGSQFIITLKSLSEGNGRFVVFGTIVKGHEMLRALVADVNASTRAVDHTKSLGDMRIVSCGVYKDPATQGPPSYIADREQGLKRKISYTSGHNWLPLTSAWEMGNTAKIFVDRNEATKGEFEKELKEEYKEEVKKYLDDRRKWEFINGTPEKRRELYESVHPSEHKAKDLLFNKKIGYQRKQKLMEQKIEAEKKEPIKNVIV